MAPPPPPRLTHFLCLPLVTPASRPQLQANLQAFRNEVTQPTARNPSGIPDRAVRPAGTLHLTLGVMSLLTPARVEAALTLLRSMDLRGSLLASRSRDAGDGDKNDKHDGDGDETESSRPAPLTITLRGLKTAHDPGKATGLYAPPVDDDGSLYAFCLGLRKAFQDAEIVVPDTRPLLLHATVLNTVYVEGRARDNRRGRAPRLTVDASDILRQYETFEWMTDIRIEKVAICRMGAKPVRGGQDEEYVIEGEVPLP